MMSDQSKSTTVLEPYNIFHFWYNELCRRLKIEPVITPKPRNDEYSTVLDFSTDRLELEDWSPLISALELDTSLHVINIRGGLKNPTLYVTEEESDDGMQHKYGVLWIEHIFNSLLQALSNMMKKTQVLTCLELHGLPILSQHLKDFVTALKENRTIKIFSLAYCPIKDEGCHAVCSCLQSNVELLNLSGCDLTSISGKYIAKLIEQQQLNRYTTTWHRTLRFSEAEVVKLDGIRRITLNCNPKIGNEGLTYILEKLEDDLWIKALDMQKCGITNEISERLFDVLSYNKSLQIADFRENDDLSTATLDRIFEILQRKESCVDAPSTFKWCNIVSRSRTSRSSKIPLKSSINTKHTKLDNTKRNKNETIIINRNIRRSAQKTRGNGEVKLSYKLSKPRITSNIPHLKSRYSSYTLPNIRRDKKNNVSAGNSLCHFSPQNFRQQSVSLAYNKALVHLCKIFTSPNGNLRKNVEIEKLPEGLASFYKYMSSASQDEEETGMRHKNGS